MNLVIFGDSNFAELVKYYFELDSDYKVVGFCVEKKYRTKDRLCGLPVVDFESIEEYFPKEEHALFSSIAYKNMRLKKAIYQKIASSGYKIATYISKDAIVDSSNKIGKNCMILPGVILEPFVTIEDNTFLNTGVTVCHHSTIGAHCVLAARSLVGGLTTVGENSFIGFNTTVLQCLNLAPETLVATNSLMMQNSEPSTLYVGSPAKAKRSLKDRGIEIL